MRSVSTTGYLGALLLMAGACSSTSSTPGKVGTGPGVSTPASAARSSPGGQDDLATKDLVANSKPAIVRVISRSGDDAGVGTGFVIERAGSIATNLHVIAGADEVDIQFLGGNTLPVTHVMAYDIVRDLAILHVDPRESLPELPLADSDAVAAGDPVIAIGNPLGVLDYTVSDGLISSVRQLDPTLTVLQISAPISQGSSGGPLFNPRGEVIGVVRAFIGLGQNLNFGIPSNYLRDLMGRDGQLTLAGLNKELAEEMARVQAKRKNSAKTGGIDRDVPVHDVALVAECSDESLHDTREQIARAISAGAPLYNAGNHEACYRIYEGTAMRLESDSPCKGVRDALGQGLLRASTKQGYTLKAWAMRDAFDGMLDVIGRKLSD